MTKCAMVYYLLYMGIMGPNYSKFKNSGWASAGAISRLAEGLHSRSDLHLLRKVWHASTGLLISYLYIAGVSKITGIQLIGAFLVGSITLEVLRLKNPLLNDKCIRLFGPLMRSSEVTKVSGVPYYAASAIIALAVFPKPVAILSILYLALGDPIASLAGVLFSKKSVKIMPGKSLHGAVAGFLTCTLVTWIFLQNTQNIYGLDLVRLSLLGGFAGAFAELLPLEIDDNFTIPVISGFILWMGFIAIQLI